MTNINTRDGSEDLIAFPQLFPKRQETGKRSERVENYGKIILNTQQNAKNRIPQVLRISQYRNFSSELPKYRMKNWPLPQYRKPQCPPLFRTDSRKIIYLVQDRAAKKHTLSSGTSPYRPYKAVPSPSPRPGTKRVSPLG